MSPGLNYVARASAARKIFAAFLIIFLLLSALTTVVSAAADVSDNSDDREALWRGSSDAMEYENDEETAKAFRKYALDGVFGYDAKLYVQQNKNASISMLLDNCPTIADFYIPARNAGYQVDKDLRVHDKDGSRLASATARVSSLLGEILEGVIAFGWLTTTLSFTIMFARIAIMPTHATQQRGVLLDFLKLGASTAILGNAWLIISLFEAIFNRFWQTYAVYSDDWRTVFKMTLSDYKAFIGGVTGVCVIFTMCMFIVHFTTLAASGNNPATQQSNAKKLFFCAIAAAGLGGVTAVCSFFFSI